MASPDHSTEEEAPLWAVAAEFADALALQEAVEVLHAFPDGRIETYSPVPLPNTGDLHGSPMRLWALAGGSAGGFAMMGMCLYAAGFDYVFDIGGRPRFSWPSYVVPTTSFALVATAGVVVVVMLLLNRLPRLNHPAFNIPGFDRASQDRYFVTVEATDRHFNPGEAERRLAMLAVPPLATHRVPR